MEELFERFQITAEDRQTFMEADDLAKLKLAFKYVYKISYTDEPTKENVTDISLRKLSKFPINSALMKTFSGTVSNPTINIFMQAFDEVLFKNLYNYLNMKLLQSLSNEPSDLPMSDPCDGAIVEILIRRNRMDLKTYFNHYSNPITEVLEILTTTELDSYIQLNIPYAELETISKVLVNQHPIDELKLATSYVWAFLKMVDGGHLL